MSTGVFRQYPYTRLTAPHVIIAQPLDAPIGNRAVQSPARDVTITRLIPLGIAALIPIAAAFIPPPAVAQTARQAYPIQQPAPELIAAYVSQVGPSQPLPLVPVAQLARPAYPTQEPATGIAALLPVAQTYIAPPQVMQPARSQATQVQQQPEQFAPFLSSNTPDYVLPGVFATVPRQALPPAQQIEPGIAPLIPVAVTQVPPQSLVRISTVQPPAQQIEPGIAPLIPVAQVLLLPSQVVRIPGAATNWTVAVRQYAPIVGPTFLKFDQVSRPSLATYPIQLPRWQLVQGAAVVPPPDFIDMTRVLRVTFNGQILLAAELDASLTAAKPDAPMDTDSIDAAVVAGTQRRTVH